MKTLANIVDIVNTVRYKLPIERMYGHHHTPQTISNMTKIVTEQVEAFNQRLLNNQYVCVYLDVTHIPIRRDTVSKESVYIALGIREDGSKEVLAYTIAPTESAHIWKDLLLDIRERNVECSSLYIRWTKGNC